MGLYRQRRARGREPIRRGATRSTTATTSSANLMFFSELGGIELQRRPARHPQQERGAAMKPSPASRSSSGSRWRCRRAAMLLELPQPVIDALTPIDSVPTERAARRRLQRRGAGAREPRRSIALETGPIDLGVQLRAIRALRPTTAACAVQRRATPRTRTLATRGHDAAIPRRAHAEVDLLVLRGRDRGARHPARRRPTSPS